MELPPFLRSAKAIFETIVPEAEREPVLRKIMILHRKWPNFWASKSGMLSRGKKARLNALPTWNESNRLRALEIWFHLRFGANAWNELKKTVRDANEIKPELAAVKKAA